MSTVSFEQISFVVQGPIDRSMFRPNQLPVTQACLESIRQWYPGSEIVLSTWEGAPVDDLTWDVLVRSEDPGGFNFIFPHQRGDPLANGNRQIVSTRNGLKSATREFAVKIRSDLVLTGNQWLHHWGRYPRRAGEWRIFADRLVTANLFTRNPVRDLRKPFHPSDWFHFGRREDLLLLWDIELEPEPESSSWFRTRPHPPEATDKTDMRRYFSEQYLWKTLLSKYGTIRFDHFAHATSENVRLTQLTFANNLIVLDVDQFPFVMQKYEGSLRSWRYSCISHREWLRLYREYCGGERISAALDRLTDATYMFESCYLAVPGSVRERAKKLLLSGNS
jgi:hypothetical protein